MSAHLVVGLALMGRDVSEMRTVVDDPVGEWRFRDADALQTLWPGASFEAVGDSGFHAVVRRRTFSRMRLEGIAASPYRCVRTARDVAAYPSDSVSVNVVLDGAIDMHEGDLTYRAEQGDVFVHRNGEFSFECHSPSRTFRAVASSRSMPSPIGPGLPLGLCTPSTLTRAYSRFAAEILEAPEDGGDLTAADESLEQSALLMQRALITEVLQRTARTARTQEELRLQVLGYVEQRLTDPELCVDHLTSVFKISRRWLFRVFEDQSETLAETIRRRRVEFAVEALERDPTLSVHELAVASGFHGRDQFTRAFRAQLGRTPSEHRLGC